MVAAVNGVAVGIGLTMLPHFDLVLVDPTARFRAPFTALGVAPEAASSVMLERSIGPQHAARLLYTSEWLSADDAVRLGLALRVCEPGTVVDKALALAGGMAVASLGSLVATRTAIVRARAAVVDAALRAESEVWKGLSVPRLER
jgi:enoyl-CoA hydratase/carnithine racemase